MERRSIETIRFPAIHRRRFTLARRLVPFAIVALCCSAGASGGYVWALLNWKDGAPRARLALADERLPLNERMDALVVVQRNAELDMALCREIARRGGKLGELATVSARRIAEAGSAPTPK